MLHLTNITKCFADGHRQLTVLDNVSLHVERGEFIAITGESGAGKTTLLSILGTLLRPEGGSYRIDGELVGDSNLENIRGAKLGFLYQDHRLLPQFSVMQNILLPTLATKQRSTPQEHRRAMQLLDFVGIASLQDSSVEVLSGGEKTRVALCRALINQPCVLLADEPTGQLDWQNAHLVSQLFQQINSSFNTTIVMATHSQEMARAAQRVYTLENGKLR